MEQAEIGIIGGSGFYEISGLENPHHLKLKTPFGQPSEKILIGQLDGRSVAFLSRHGIGHRYNPSEVNYRANLYALKLLGVQHLISVSAVGSFKEEFKPTDLVIPDQYIDRTFQRRKTFFEDGIVAHVSMADPACPTLSQLALRLATELKLNVHYRGIYCNMEGPQFSSRGESHLYRQLGFSVIGMTQAVEAKLARELEMCFLPLAFVTDYDCWHEGTEAVTVEMVIRNLNQNAENAKKLIQELSREINPQRDQCRCSSALANAIITAPVMIPTRTFRRLEIVIGKYIKERL